MSKNALDTRAQLNRVKLEGQTVSHVSFMYRTFNYTLMFISVLLSEIIYEAVKLDKFK